MDVCYFFKCHKVIFYNMPGMLGHLSSQFSDKTSLLFENWLPSFSLPVCYCSIDLPTCKNILVFGRLDKFSLYVGLACVGPALSHLRFGYVPLNLENFIFFEREV